MHQCSDQNLRLERAPLLLTFPLAPASTITSELGADAFVSMPSSTFYIVFLSLIMYLDSPELLLVSFLWRLLLCL
ncbi:unnamed protein product [Hymenolepis diminuta]|uniref:Uncharacterized protein n=1 Tax=Hymenolepis diminuta TaxID=6216 RepID=A0A564YNJ5_HYMDI|nr:unnamed protein product [Hymenolepis diminuta]